MTNENVIALINGLNAIRAVDLPISVSFTLSQDLLALQDAYKPYSEALSRTQGDPGKMTELQALAADVSLKPVQKKYMNFVKEADVNISLVSLSALSDFIFCKKDAD